MKIDLEEIRDLVLHEILGTLTEKDKAFLEEAVANNAEARTLRAEMKAKLDTPTVNSYLSSDKDEDYTISLLSTFKNRKRRRRTLQIASLTAAIIVCGSIGYLTLNGRKEGLDNRIIATKQKKPNVEVVLSNGQIFNLDSSDQRITSGGVNLNTSNFTLSYLTTNNSVPQMATIIVPVGRNYTLQLEDGTEVQLNSATTVRFPLKFATNKREITVNGEAYIKAAANASKPLFIRLPSTNVEVLGTEFNVNTYDSGINKIALIKGAVKVNSYKESHLLKPGKELIQTANGMTLTEFDESELLAWREGKYYFSDARLDEVCRVVARWYGTKVKIDNKLVGAERFTGVIYRNQPLDYLLEAIKATNFISYETDDQGTIHIR